MIKGKVQKIDFSRRRLGMLADKFYNEENYVSALRISFREYETYGGDADIFARLSDIYEAMNLQGTAINWWFRYLDVAEEEDLPDVYEGLAINFLNLGQESPSAYYYNRLIDVDDSLPEEAKLDIIEAFSTSKKEKFRFVYPPELADYSKEVNVGSKALKAGDCARAVEEFSKIPKGAKQFAQAKEMQAVALLLEGKSEAAEKTCEELLSVKPDDIRALATLAAIYLEQERREESRQIAEKLSKMRTEDADELYKIATVCCENGMHEEAYFHFALLDKKTPYDGRILYFKGVSAYKSNHLDEAERTLETLCGIYPDAEVAKYYLRALRAYRDGEGEKPNLIYFYHLPQEEREFRCHALLELKKYAKEEAQLFGLLALQDGYFRWCFDEMDGSDHELQYLGLITAIHAHMDDFVREVLLDYEVVDVLKIEALRMLLARNEENEFGLVLYNIYKRIHLPRVRIGRKRHKKFINAYSKLAAKFMVLKDGYGEKIAQATEKLYRALEHYNSLDLVDSEDDCACAIFMLSGLKELGNDPNRIASAFDANVTKVKVLLSAAVSEKYGVKKEEEELKKDEID